MSLTYAKEFSWKKNGPNSPYFEKGNSKSPDFLLIRSSR
jgi:hypothetical protein